MVAPDKELYKTKLVGIKKVVKLTTG